MTTPIREFALEMQEEELIARRRPEEYEIEDVIFDLDDGVAASARDTEEIIDRGKFEGDQTPF